MTTRRARLLILTGVVGLASMRAAYDLTYEPAPAVRVEWRKDLPAWRRTLLEAYYRLEDPQAPHGTSYAYALSDTRTGNIRALVTDRYVVNTGDIDRVNFAISWESLQESDRFMWIADRVPVLRYTLVRIAVFVTFLGMIVVGVAGTRPPAPDGLNHRPA